MSAFYSEGTIEVCKGRKIQLSLKKYTIRILYMISEVIWDLFGKIQLIPAK